MGMRRERSRPFGSAACHDRFFRSVCLLVRLVPSPGVVTREVNLARAARACVWPAAQDGLMPEVKRRAGTPGPPPNTIASALGGETGHEFWNLEFPSG